jgi:hypothetical protein
MRAMSLQKASQALMSHHHAQQIVDLAAHAVNSTTSGKSTTAAWNFSSQASECWSVLMDE